MQPPWGTGLMAIFVLAVVLFVGVGVYLIAKRSEMSYAMSMFLGSKSVPGCAVAVGICFLLMALVAVVLYQRGLFGQL